MANTWGTNVWGINSFGEQDDVTLTLTGISASSSIGASTTQANADVEPTTLSATFTIEGVVAGASALVQPTGIGFNIVTGNEGIGIGVPVTGSSASTSINGVTIDDQYLIGEGWGRETWGSFAWGDNYSVQLQGIPLSIVTGNEDAFTDVTVAISGQELQAAITPVGTKADSDNEIAHSFLISATLDNVVIEANAEVEVSGVSASTAVGQSEGGTIQEVPVTGVSANVFIGNEDTAANANVFPTGISATFTPGQISYIASYDVSGSEATFTVGQTTAIGSATVIPTGIDLTTAIGSPNIIAWAEVDTGTSVTWKEVDLAA